MRFVVAIAACLLSTGALAQTTNPNAQIPLSPSEARATYPYGARYYPGVGFRYVLPPAERVYGYYAGPRVYSYRARPSCASARTWFWPRDRRCGYARDVW